MKEPLQITYRRLPPSNSVEQCVRERLQALETSYRDILSCGVVIEANRFGEAAQPGVHIHLDVGVPGTALWVDRDLPIEQADNGIVPGLHRAFAAIERQLAAYWQRVELAAGAADLRLYGSVSELATGMNYGVITSSSGTEIYFHRNSVLDDAFDRIQVGSKVAFDAAPSLLGAQATRVKLIDH